MAQSIDKALLDVLVCPESRAPVVLDGDWLYSTDPATRRRYPIRDDIPIMLIDESEVVTEQVFSEVMARAGKPPVEGQGACG